ncbi:MAG: hypothetical protein ACTSRI_16370 [Promethearchaeota archaeon]
MATIKKKITGLHQCCKCGNIMVERVVASESPEKGFEKILQCIVCRHWISLE